MSTYDVRLVAGSGNPEMAEEISKFLGIPLEPAKIGTFADGEISIQFENNIRGSDIYIIQPMSPPDVNDNLMELLLSIHTARLSSAKRVTAVVPYYGYARQDRKTKPRVPISASVVAQLIEAMKPTRIITMDLHCGQIQGFFKNIPVENLYAECSLIGALEKYLTTEERKKDSMVIVSPDAGGVARADRVAVRLDHNAVVTILKRRKAANQISTMEMVGDVEQKICVIVDDMIDTAGTLCKAAQLLKDHEASRVIAVASHGLFSNGGVQRIHESCLERVFVTNSLPQKETSDKLSIVPVGDLFGEAIRRLHDEKSLSSLFC